MWIWELVCLWSGEGVCGRGVGGAVLVPWRGGVLCWVLWLALGDGRVLRCGYGVKGVEQGEIKKI